MAANQPPRDHMKNNLRWAVLLSLTLAVALPGCSKKTDASAEMEKAASALATAEPIPDPAAAAQPAQPIQAAPAPDTTPSPAPAAQMNQAMVAYKAGNLEDAVTRLQNLRAMPTMTSQQRMAMNDAMAAVMSDIYILASKGDSRAIQAVKQYEQMQTQRR
jgi:hypothetical protein